MKKNAEVFNYFFDFLGNDFISTLPQGNEKGSDNEKLLFFQWKYLSEKDEKSFVKLWQFFTLLCIKAIRKEIKIKKIYFDQDEIEYKADIATEYVLRRYKTYERERGERYCIKNFVAAAHDGAIHALYSDSENDFYLEMCKTLNGKPIKELGKRGLNLGFVKINEQENFDEDLEKGQMLLF